MILRATHCQSHFFYHYIIHSSAAGWRDGTKPIIIFSDQSCISLGTLTDHTPHPHPGLPHTPMLIPFCLVSASQIKEWRRGRTGGLRGAINGDSVQVCLRAFNLHRSDWDLGPLSPLTTLRAYLLWVSVEHIYVLNQTEGALNTSGHREYFKTKMASNEL